MAKEKNTEATSFVNPFKPGVSYDDFLNAIPEGVSIKDYCEGQTLNDLDETPEQKASSIAWLEKECKCHVYNKENKEANLKRAREEHAKLQGALTASAK